MFIRVHPWFFLYLHTLIRLIPAETVVDLAAALTQEALKGLKIILHPQRFTENLMLGVLKAIFHEIPVVMAQDFVSGKEHAP